MDIDVTSSNPADTADLPVLLERIRARYKLLCTSLGVRPRLAVASTAAEPDEVGIASVNMGLETVPTVKRERRRSGVFGAVRTGTDVARISGLDEESMQGLMRGAEGSGVGRGMAGGVDTKMLRF